MSFLSLPMYTMKSFQHHICLIITQYFYFVSWYRMIIRELYNQMYEFLFNVVPITIIPVINNRMVTAIAAFIKVELSIFKVYQEKIDLQYPV